MAVPFLVNQLGSAARIAVEVAWGADITDVFTAWAWTDITDDVRISEGINLKHGRGDEAEFSQPASCSFTLDNTASSYSLGGRSPNWPNVRKNTPVRVKVDANDGTGYRALFIGYADSWQPVWDHSANIATVELTASGILRRLAQHSAPVLSAMRRRLSVESNVVAYWPLEEGKLATSGRSAITGHPDMQITGGVDWAADSESFPSTVQMPKLKKGGFGAYLPSYTYTPTTGYQVRALMAFPEGGSGMVNEAVICRIQIDHRSLATVEIRYLTGGGLRTVGYSYSATGGYSQVFTNSSAFAVDGEEVRLFFELQQVGTGILWRTGIQWPGSSGLSVSATLAASTLGRIWALDYGPEANLEGLAIGQVVVQNAITSVFTDSKELDAFDNELTATRFSRLTAEASIERTVSGDGVTAITDGMGPQRPEALMDLLQQIQEVDRGIIADGRVNGGLVFYSRYAVESQLPTMTIDVGAGGLGAPLAPIDDDQGLLNKATVSRQDGASVVYEDVDGPLGTAAVGVYDGSLTINSATDDVASLRAGWLVSMGTVEGYRYPEVELDFAHRPALVPGMLILRPGARIDLTNISTAATQHSASNVSLTVQGFEQTITPHSWRAKLICTPFDPWSIGFSANTDGTPVAPSTNDQIMRLDTEAAKLNSAALLGATSLSVATTAGPLWTTDAADLPFDISVGGIVVRVTNITGASSPQTFTVTGVTKALASGLAVQLHEPERLGL